MAERPDDQWTNEGMGDRGGAARHRREPGHEPEERWPDEGFGDRSGAARKRIIEGNPRPNGEPPEQNGYWQSKPSEDVAGYGGGRERVEQFNDRSFGDTGWGGRRGPSQSPPPHGRQHSPDYPEGARPVSGEHDWDRRYARENSDKYGQWGGKPIEQRGGPQSRGGWDHLEENIGDARDISPRGGYGIRETERWGHANPGVAARPNHAGKGPKNYKRSDERIADDVCHRLTEHPEVDATDIEVSVQGGEVTLTGTVHERRARYEAEEVAANTPGVRDVVNQLRVG